MDSQTMRQQMTAFTDSSTRTFSRVVRTKEVIEKIISQNGETKEVSDLVKLFYQMIVDEYELLLLLLNNLSEDSYVKELRSSHELEEGLTSIKNILEGSIADAKEHLKSHKKKKTPVNNTGIKKYDKNKNLTRQLLNSLGLK